MRLWPLNEERWVRYCLWHTYRDEPVPERTGHMILVGDAEPMMGVGIYSTDGKYMFVESFSMAPNIGKSEYKRASRLLISALKAQASVSSKNIIVLCAFKAMVRRLEAVGFKVGASTPMVYSPWWPTPQKNAPTGSQTSGSEETSEKVAKPTRTIDSVAPVKEPRKKMKRKVAGKSKT